MVRSPGFGSNILCFFIFSWLVYLGYVKHNSHMILTCWPIMQKVRFHIFFIFTQAAYRTTISRIVLLSTFNYRLYIIFSLRGRFPFIQTVWSVLILGFSTFIHTNHRISFDLFLMYSKHFIYLHIDLKLLRYFNSLC